MSLIVISPNFSTLMAVSAGPRAMGATGYFSGRLIVRYSQPRDTPNTFSTSVDETSVPAFDEADEISPFEDPDEQPFGGGDPLGDDDVSTNGVGSEKYSSMSRRWLATLSMFSSIPRTCFQARP